MVDFRLEAIRLQQMFSQCCQMLMIKLFRLAAGAAYQVMVRSIADDFIHRAAAQHGLGDDICPAKEIEDAINCGLINAGHLLARTLKKLSGRRVPAEMT